eukprot:scaffold3153_cov111-Isochrysis_galbana.AAC.4
MATAAIRAVIARAFAIRIRVRRCALASRSAPTVFLRLRPIRGDLFVASAAIPFACGDLGARVVDTKALKRSAVRGARAHNDWQLARPNVQVAPGASGRRSAGVSAGTGRTCCSGFASDVGGRRFGWSGPRRRIGGICGRDSM